jgi:hypothetical protein
MSQAQRAHATIEVSRWDPTPYDEREGAPQLVHVAVAETFAGDLQGQGTVTFLQVLAADGSASFVGIERFVGSLGGREGSFVLQDHGTLSVDGQVSGEWFVVAGSGTDALTGLSGGGGFKAALGEKADGYLDYRLD